MELFPQKRYGHEEVSPKTLNADSILKRIAKNKLSRLKHKQKAKEKGKFTRAAIEKTNLERKKKRLIKQQIEIFDPSKDGFIDTNIDKMQIDSTPQEEDKTVSSGYTVLGGANYEKKVKVTRMLPQWLLNPILLPLHLHSLKVKINKIKQLDDDLKENLLNNSIRYLFPIQVKLIPHLVISNKNADILQPKDICVSAPTGSGKTLAFVLPIIQELKKYGDQQIRALVILPTQDLALQIFKTFKKYAQNTKVTVCLISTSNSFFGEQISLLYKNEAFGILSKADILVCTAGRLVDHIKGTPHLCLDHLRFLIIDEADRVLDNIQNDWLYHLDKHISNDFARPQKLLFSATLSQDPEKLEKLDLFQPQLFTCANQDINETDLSKSDKFIGKYTTPQDLSEKYIIANLDLKPLVLSEFIKREQLRKTLIFTNSVETAHRLTILLKSLLENRFVIEEISSNLLPKDRINLINKFSQNAVDLIVCTDRLARGIDLPSVECVISYSVPKFIKTYIHRAGRTARAGESGLAVTLLHEKQVDKFQNLLKQAGKSNLEEIKIDKTNLEELNGVYTTALEKLKLNVRQKERYNLKIAKSAKTVKKSKNY